jgi:hypothetical protein
MPRFHYKYFIYTYAAFHITEVYFVMWHEKRIVKQLFVLEGDQTTVYLQGGYDRSTTDHIFSITHILQIDGSSVVQYSDVYGYVSGASIHIC